jgi:ribonuclease PH
VLEKLPLTGYVAAVSAGIVENQLLLDLCYEEDSHAMVDLNCVMNDRGELIELQGTGEGRAFTVEEQRELVALCQKGIVQLQALQKEIVGEL